MKSLRVGMKMLWARSLVTLVLIGALMASIPTTPAGAGPGDPGTFETRVAAGNDDAEERANGSMLVGSSDLELVFDGGGDQTVGIRFASMGVPAGATVTSAWLQFTVDEVSVDPTNLLIAAEASSFSASYTQLSGGISSRPTTIGTVSWDPAPWPTKKVAGPDQRTPDLSAVVQEVVDRPDWALGAPINFIITGTGERVADSFEGGVDRAPLLHVEYVEASNAYPVLTVEAPTQAQEFTNQELVTLAATAIDLEDGDLSPSVTWQSSLDGALGTGSSIQVGPLSIGSHVLQASVTDSANQTSISSVTVSVVDGMPASVFDTSVSASTDDAEERASGAMLVNSSDLELTFDGGGHQTVGFRFGSVDIPNGSTVSGAWVQFTTDEVSTDPAALQIEAEAADASSTFTSIGGSISSRPRSNAAISWDPAPWTVVGEAGPAQQTPDLSVLVQEVLDRPGWAQGGPISFIVTGTGERVADSFEGGSSRAPRLHVEYMSPANQTPTLSVATPVDDQVFTEGDVVAFSASAADVEDGDLSQLITWTSGRDGAIGAGSSVQLSTLSVGIHSLTAQVVDSQGAIAEVTMRISVQSLLPYLIGAGDIGECGADRDEATADLVAAFPDAAAVTFGDNAYPSGTVQDFQQCYDPSWGAFAERTYPSVGNHDYDTPNASGYFSYFGAVAGNPTEGWYSYDIGSWHVVVLNSNCSQIGGCEAGSAQAQWLEADLAANPGACTAAYWHHPQFSSGLAPNSQYDAFWEILYEAGADVVLNGHSHHYERFAPQNPSGLADPAHGIRQFVVGTGGDGLFSQGTIAANSEVQVFGTFGVIGLGLGDGFYTWEFMPVEGQTATDSGQSSCVDPSPTLSTSSAVVAPADDAEERPSGLVSTGSSDLELTLDAGRNQTVGTRFDSVDVPPGATITGAWVQFTTDDLTSEATDLTIVGEAADASAAFSSARFDISSRATTAASSTWSPAPWLTGGQAGPDQRTPDLAAIVQEVVDRPGWQQNGPISLIFNGTGQRVGESFEGSPSSAPVLHVDYLLPANARPVVTILSPNDGSSFTEVDVILLDGSALDAEDGDLASSIAWTSSVDGVLGTGASLNVSGLSLGAHVIQASVTDSDGQTSTASSLISVVLENPPTILEYRINSATDDAEQKPSGTVITSSSDLELTFDYGGDQTVGMRFDDLDVPDGATITNAWIQFTVDEVSTDAASLMMRAEANDDAPAYQGTSGSISGRATTGSSVPWAPEPWPLIGASGLDQRTPDLSVLLQDVIDRPGWVTGNSFNLILTGTGERVAESFEGGSLKAPLLHIEYLL